jgi:hypothetical protein
MNQHVDRADLRRTLAEWIERGKNVIGEEIRCIKLMHEASSDPVDVIPAKEIPTDVDSENLDTLTEKIACRLEADAAGFKGAEQQYFVELYRGSAERSQGRLPCAIAILKGERRGSSSKVTDEKGLLALAGSLALRGFDAIEGRSKADQKQYVDSLNREAGLRVENDALRGQLEEMRTIVNDQKSQLESNVETNAMVREIFLDAKTMIPVLINRMAGEQILPMSELAPEQLLLRELVRELDKDEIRLIIEGLASKKPRIGIMLGELILKVQGEDVRRKDIREMAKKVVEQGKAKVKEIDAGSSSSSSSSAPRMNGHAPTPLLGATKETTFR